mmetsp:Transcript_14552/g.52375  ORF Transcript_14552/g.52375 Transcript_14552/m.52375 type:complete len:219 (+) Transcript_14552:1989-2645(+)
MPSFASISEKKPMPSSTGAGGVCTATGGGCTGKLLKNAFPSTSGVASAVAVAAAESGAAAVAAAVDSAAAAAAAAAALVAAISFASSAAPKSRCFRSSRRASSSNRIPRNPQVSSSSFAAQLRFVSQNSFKESLPPAVTAPSNSWDTATSSAVCKRKIDNAVGEGFSASAPPASTAPAGRTPKPARFPPNPNVAPQGRRIHAGAFFIGCFGPGCCTPY